jgi:hypothetical protein
MCVDHRRLEVTVTSKMSDLLQRDTRLSQPTAERVSERMERHLSTFLSHNINIIQSCSVDRVHDRFAPVLSMSAVR